MHRVAATAGEAGALALEAGIDVELPHVGCFGEPLAGWCATGGRRGAGGPRGAPGAAAEGASSGCSTPTGRPSRRPCRWRRSTSTRRDNRALARELAEESVVLLPTTARCRSARRRVGGARRPVRRRPARLPRLLLVPQPRVLSGHADLGARDRGADAARRRCGGSCRTSSRTQRAAAIQDADRSGFEAAVAPAARADVCVAVVGDRPGLFGRGTSGEGCDAEDLSLPGVQGDLVDALLDTGTPVVLVVVSGRPYALGRYAGRPAAIVQAFIPGEEGGPALARVLTGRGRPDRPAAGAGSAQRGRAAGHLPASRARRQQRRVSNIDPTPAFPFGHGLSYTTFEYADFAVGADEIAVDGEVSVSCVVRNVGDRAGAEVVQLYLSDPVAQVTRPVIELVGYARVPLEAGASARVTFTLHADRTSFTGATCGGSSSRATWS